METLAELKLPELKLPELKAPDVILTLVGIASTAHDKIAKQTAAARRKYSYRHFLGVLKIKL